jgi:hypothetical protein
MTTTQIQFMPRITPKPTLYIALSDTTPSRGRPVTIWAIVRPSTTSPNGYVVVEDTDVLFMSELQANFEARGMNPRYRAARASDFYYRRPV